MPWNDALQFAGAGMGFNIEFGLATLVPAIGGASVEVATRMTRLGGCAGFVADAGRPNSLWIDGTVTNGHVTISDPDPGGNDVIWYLLFGLA